MSHWLSGLGFTFGRLSSRSRIQSSTADALQMNADNLAEFQRAIYRIRRAAQVQTYYTCASHEVLGLLFGGALLQIFERLCIRGRKTADLCDGNPSKKQL